MMTFFFGRTVTLSSIEVVPIHAELLLAAFTSLFNSNNQFQKLYIKLNFHFLMSFVFTIIFLSK